MPNKKSFILYHSYWATFSRLTDEEAGQLIKMIFAHEADGVTPDADRVVEIAFTQIKSDLERNRAEYESVCEKRRESGKLGGRPKKQEVSEESKCFSEKAKKPDNVDDAVNDKVNENENDNAVVNDNDAARGGDKRDDNNKIYGKYVRLTEEQYRSLCAEYGEAAVTDCINRADSYIMKSGCQPYVNHYTTLSQWLKKDAVPKPVQRSAEQSNGKPSLIDQIVADALLHTPKPPQ
ncbi:MAG: hypothetical protein J6C96_01350 [Oscillospiraceae bacterium]|nr:hypothetical protein [Oscillospiraceae bacterium]